MCDSLVWSFASAGASAVTTYVYLAALQKPNNACAKSAFKVFTLVLLSNFIVSHVVRANRSGMSGSPARFHASDPF
jgi:hypothetical protein